MTDGLVTLLAASLVVLLVLPGEADLGGPLSDNGPVLDNISDSCSICGLCHKGDGLLKHASLLELVVLLGSNLQRRQRTFQSTEFEERFETNKQIPVRDPAGQSCVQLKG